MSQKVRVRFAPSPTGPLHIGGVRTALYNYLFAKKNKGVFILRIEDTDQNRFVEGAEDYINKALSWCGLEFDESPKKGGNYIPYKQSERRDLYKKYIEEILKTDFAYIAFDTNEELENIRSEYEKEGKIFSYNHESRKILKNSISLTKEEVKKLIDNKTTYVVRFKNPENRILNLNDIIRGDFTINTQTLDDKVLMKNDGMPTYHFANIVDDHLMDISHVIRGEEWLPSMALHEMLYEAMKWESPKFAHLPLILKPEGKGKLSKRDGDKHGFPVFPMNWEDSETKTISAGYKEQGYLPEAFINMLALLGWSPSDDKEILSLEEMISEFDLEKVHKSGARFNPEKAKWFNHQYIQKEEASNFITELQEILAKNNIKSDNKRDLLVIESLKERFNFIWEIWENGKYFWISPDSYDEKSFKKVIKEDTKDILENFISDLRNIEFSAESINKLIHDFAETKGLGLGRVMQPLRLGLVGEMKGPDIPVIMNILEKEESILRLENLIKKI